MTPLADRWLHDTVSALVYSLAQDVAPGASPNACNAVTAFVLRETHRMAEPFRSGVSVATLALDAWGLASTGHRFHTLPADARDRLLRRWRQSSLGPVRDVVRFYASLAALGVHSSRLLETAAEETPAALPAAALPPRAEIVVIGSGPGGSITAALLAEAGRDVVLLEEGPWRPLGSTPPFTVAEMEEKYRHGGLSVALGPTKVAYVEGRCVGGGSEINSGLYHRTPPEILATWRSDFAVDGLTDADLHPHFAACEHDVGVTHLAGPAPAASLKLHEGARQLGWKSLEVPRWIGRAGSDATDLRRSMTQTYVPRFLAAGGRLLPDSRVARLRRRGASWEVQLADRTGPRSLLADTVFVCAGAVHTPALLQRSGLAPRAGRSFRLHPTVKLVARFPEPVNAADMGVPVHQVKEFSPRLSFGCSISSPPYLALGLLDHRTACRSVAEAWPYQAIYYAMITGTGAGSVRTLPGFSAPLVRYALSDVDHRDLADGLRLLATSLFASGAVEILPSTPGFPALRSAADLARLPPALQRGAAGLMTIHLFSSCAMGERRDRCVADSFGRVHGEPNLRVSDASLLCTAPGVNPQGTIMALARRNALHFLGKL